MTTLWIYEGAYKKTKTTKARRKSPNKSFKQNIDFSKLRKQSRKLVWQLTSVGICSKDLASKELFLNFEFFHRRFVINNN